MFRLAGSGAIRNAAARPLAAAMLAAIVMILAGTGAHASSLNWNDRPATNLLTTTDVAVVDGVTVSTSATGAGSAASRTGNILPTTTFNGHTGIIQLTMDANTDNGTVSTTTTFSFSEPVYNLTFTLIDIDGGTAQGWNDTVQFGPVPTAVSIGSNVAYNPTTGRATSRGLAISDTRGDLTVRFPGPVTTVTVQYIADDASGSNPGTQVLGIDDLTFDLSPRVTVSKVTLGGTGTFSFSGSNGFDNKTVTTLSPGTPVSAAADALAALATATTITEGADPAHALTGISCTGLGSGSASVDLATRSVTLSASAIVVNANIACTFTNRRIPTVSLQKVTQGGAGGPFAFTATNLASTPSGITTSAAGTPTPASPSAIPVTTTGTAVTITETSAAGYFVSGASCTDANAALTGNTGTIGTLSGTTLTIPAAAVVDGAAFRCTFTNTLAVPQLTLAKSASVTSVSSAGTTINYTITVSNTGNVTISGITVSDPLGSPVCATSGNATIVTLAPSSQETCTLTYTVSQADLDSAGGGDGDIDNTATASGTYGSTPVSASASHAVALVTNPQLSVTKTADDTTDVEAGQIITYTYVVANTGNQTITNIGLNDSHNGSGPVPVPGNETLSTDSGPAGDSSDATANDGIWSSLAPGDAVTFTATYTVTQQDVDTRQ